MKNEQHIEQLADTQHVLLEKSTDGTVRDMFGKQVVDEPSGAMLANKHQSKLTPKALHKKLKQSGVSGMRAPIHHIQPSPHREPTAEEKQAQIDAALIKRGKAILMQETLEILNPISNNAVAQHFMLVKRCGDLTKALIEAARRTGKTVYNTNVVAPAIMEELTRCAGLLPPAMARLLHTNMPVAPPAIMAAPVNTTLSVMSPPDRSAV